MLGCRGAIASTISTRSSSTGARLRTKQLLPKACNRRSRAERVVAEKSVCLVPLKMGKPASSSRLSADRANSVRVLTCDSPNRAASTRRQPVRRAKRSADVRANIRQR